MAWCEKLTWWTRAITAHLRDLLAPCVVKHCTLSLHIVVFSSLHLVGMLCIVLLVLYCAVMCCDVQTVMQFTGYISDLIPFLVR